MKGAAMSLEGYEEIEKLSDKERIELIKKWSSRFYDHTYTFAGNLGMQTGPEEDGLAFVVDA
jgi:hypothetical protein